MTNLNKLSSSVERFEEQKKEKVLYIDEAQFRLVHTPKPTDTWKKLDEKFSKRKEEKQSIDPMMMNKLMDSQDIVNDFNSFNDHEYNRIMEDARVNEEDIATFRKKAKEIEEKIVKINEEKKTKIIDAMEDGGKDVSVVIKRPKTFSKITKFFAIRFNLLGYIQNSVISRLNERVRRYREEVLSKIDDSIGE